MCDDIDSERIPMPRDGEDFKRVRELFHKTIPECLASILMVEKNKNGFLRDRYNRYMYEKFWKYVIRVCTVG